MQKEDTLHSARLLTASLQPTGGMSSHVPSTQQGYLVWELE